MKPLLQIVHVSDLHIRTDKLPPRAAAIRRCSEPFRSLREFWAEGLAPFDPQAPRKFSDFISEVAGKSEHGWRGETWLVDTGDLSTLGDDGSLKKGVDLLEKLCANHGVKKLNLHGNHDAWPGDFPLGASAAEWKLHRAKLRSDYFPRTWPEKPLIFRSAQVDIQLYGLNSVVHDPKKNAFAWGEIVHDRYWEGEGKRIRLKQMQDLCQLAWENVKDDRPTVRVVATHHPIVCPSHSPWARVWNRKELIPLLNGPDFPGRVHLILSGHNHGLFPEQGALPRELDEANQPPLKKGQLQLVVGSLFRAGAADGNLPTAKWPQQVQVLRFFWNPIDRCVELLRLVALRRPGSNRYRRNTLDARPRELMKIRPTEK